VEENSNKMIASLCPPQLDSSKYRLFERRRRPVQRRQHASAPSSVANALPRVPNPEVTAWRSAVNTPAWGTQSSASTVAVPAPPASPWQSGTGAVVTAPRPEIDVRKPPTLASVGITSCAGGSGASTIAANLAAGLALAGHSVMFDDYTNNHTFSYFFGVNPVQENLVRSFTTAAGGVIHLVFNAAGTSDESVAVITALQNQLNWVISDCEFGQIPGDVETVLAVCAPEPRSLMSAVTLKRWLDRQRPQQKFFFLMNQYDATSALHRRMRDRLADQVGPMLLSVTIPRAERLCEALFKGKTLFEFAPGDVICEEFRRLAAWLSAVFQTDSVHQ
jgi:cellulose biosynthesis protein BcsQ